MEAVRNAARAVAVLGLCVVPAVSHGDDSPANPVSVRQTLPSVVVQGQPFSAEVFVTNTANRPAEDVEVVGQWSKSHLLTSAEPPSVKTLGSQTLWQLGRLSPGETRRLRLGFGPSDQPPGNEFQSSFRVSSRLETADTKSVPLRRQAVELAVTGPTVAVVGQPITVQLQVKNPDAAEVRGVFINSKLPDGLSHPSGTDLEAEVKVVAAGHTESLPLVITPTKAGTTRTVFRVSGPGLPPVEREFSITATEVKLEIALHGPRTLPRNWPGTYEVTVRNGGEQTAAGLDVEVAVPPGFDDLRATEGAKFDSAGRRLVWSIGDLRAGESRTLVWLGVAGQTGEYQLTAGVGPGGTAVKKAEWRTQVQTPTGDGR